MRGLSVALAAATLFIASCGGESPLDLGVEIESSPLTEAAAVPRSPIDKMALWDMSSGPHLRGADLHPCWLDTTGVCVESIDREDVRDLRDLGANLINASYGGVFSQVPPYEVDSAALEHLDDLIEWAEEVGIYVVIHFRTGPGRNEAAIVDGDDPLFEVWADEAAHEAWIDMWRFTAQRYRDSDVIIGYNLMVEPRVNTLVDPEGLLSPLEFREAVEGTLQDWNALATEITAAIRQVDTATPIILSSLNWADPAWFDALLPTGDERTIYSLHAYAPDEYTGQDYEPGAAFEISYPDAVHDGEDVITFDQVWLEGILQPVVDFSERHDVPIYVGEFGSMRWVPGAPEFHVAQTELFERHGWNYAYYTWRADTADWDGFNLEYGTDPEIRHRVPDNPLLAVHRERWAMNSEYPETAD